MKLNVSEWKEFKISDLFDISLSKGDIKADDVEDGNIILISSGETNNGVVKHISENGDGQAEIFEGNKITVDMFCNTYYQQDNFYAVSHGRVNILTPKFTLNKYIGLFIASIIKKEQFRFSYGRAVYSNVAADIIIKLPALPDGSPDWQFMEDYIKSLHHKPLTTRNKPHNVPDLKINEWKEFKIQRTQQQGGLFEIKHCKCGSAGELEDGNDINYIGAKKLYNGVMRSVTIDEKLVSKGHGIMFICDGEGSVGYTNYMDEDFIGSTTTSIGYDESITELNAMFLVTVLDKERIKYSYGRKYRSHLIDTVIKLPVKYNPDGSIFNDITKKYSDDGYIPDWQFMEDYIKKLPYSDRLNG